jgi:non-ribosomal peptide synthase protein (TIGR01720 family)
VARARPDFAPPHTPVEVTLARLWSQALSVERVGVRDNFFELGGDSIHSIQIVARARAEGIRVTSQQIFDHPTVERLAAVAGVAAAPGADGGPAVGPMALTPIQRWFFELDLPAPHHWNQAVLLELEPQVSPDALEAILGALLDHHDALRLRCTRTPEGWRAENAPPGERWPLARFDLSALPASERTAALERQAARIQAGFDLERGPLVAAAYFRCGDSEPARFLLAAHHLAVDGVSFRLLLEDLETVRSQVETGQPLSLPPRTTSFRDWARRLEESAGSPQLEAELGWWLGQPGPPARLPVDTPGENLETDAREVSFGLDEERTHRLLQEVPTAGRAAAHEVLLAAVAEVLARRAGERLVWIDLEGHGREELIEDADVSRTVGWFTSLFPLALDLRSSLTPLAALREVKARLRRVPRHGAGFGVLRYMGRPEVRERLRSLPVPEVMFNYLGQLDGALQHGSPFRPAAEPVGPLFGPRGRRPHLLQIVGGVTGGRLGVRVLYSAAQFRPETVERLARDIEAVLREILAGCLAGAAEALAPSDFPEADLTPGELARILDGDRVPAGQGGAGAG